MRETTGRSQARVRRWSPIGTRTAGRETAWARHLGDYRGILQCDGYAGYAKIARAPHSNGLRLAGCWAHLRRKFYDLHVNGESIVATATVEQLTQLWSIEDQVRGQPPQARLEARRAASADVVRTLYDLWAGELPRVSGKSKLADAIRYAQSRRPALEVFLADGRAELDSNIVERAIRPQAITRKNALFAGSATGGRTWAAIATMLQTCRMNEVDPSAWASQTLERIANRWPNSNIDALMPWNFKPVE